MSYYEIVFLQYFFNQPIQEGLPPFGTSWYELLLFMPLEILREKSWQKQQDMLGLQLRCEHYDIGVVTVNDNILIKLQNGTFRLRAGAWQYTIYEPQTGRNWGYDHQQREWTRHKDEFSEEDDPFS